MENPKGKFSLLARVGSCVILLGLLLAPSTIQAQQRIRLNGALALEYALSFVAIQKGFLAQEGITVEGPDWMPGGRVRDSLFAKDYDFSLMSTALVGLARERGMPFKVIFPLYERQIFGLFTHKDFPKKNVSDLKQILKGMKVGHSGPGTGSWAAVASIYRKLGLDPLKDMENVVMGASDPRLFLAALKTGKADAVSIWEPIVTMGETEGVLTPLVDVRDPATHKKLFGEVALSLMLVTREDVIREKRDVVRRMVNAHKRGLDYLKATPAIELAELIHPLLGKTDKGLLTRILQYVKDGLVISDGTLSVASYQAGVQVVVDAGIVKAAPHFDQIMDTSFAGRQP